MAWQIESRDPRSRVEKYLSGRNRLLVIGESGVGKSTLCAQIADALLRTGRDSSMVSVDPGSPAFGPPGAVSRAQRRAGIWQVTDLEAVCTLNAVRFRLPLATAAQVKQLVPFHLSRRYESTPETVFREVAAFFRPTIIPAALTLGSVR
jgi:ribonuclease Z